MFRDLFANDWVSLSLAGLGTAVVLILLVVAARVVRYIPNDRVGIVEKRWSPAAR